MPSTCCDCRAWGDNGEVILRWIPYYFVLTLWVSKNKLQSTRLLLGPLGWIARKAGASAGIPRSPELEQRQKVVCLLGKGDETAVLVVWVSAYYGGFEMFAEQLAVRLAERGHYVTVFCEARKRRRGVQGGVKLRHVRLRNLGPLRTVAYDAACLWQARSSFDVIYMLGYGSSAFCWVPRMGAPKFRSTWTGWSGHEANGGDCAWYCEWLRRSRCGHRTELSRMLSLLRRTRNRGITGYHLAILSHMEARLSVAPARKN